MADAHSAGTKSEPMKFGTLSYSLASDIWEIYSVVILVWALKVFSGQLGFIS